MFIIIIDRRRREMDYALPVKAFNTFLYDNTLDCRKNVRRKLKCNIKIPLKLMANKGLKFQKR